MKHTHPLTNILLLSREMYLMHLNELVFVFLVCRDSTNPCGPPGQYGGDYSDIEKRWGSFRFSLSGWDDCPAQSSQGKEPDSS